MDMNDITQVDLLQTSGLERLKALISNRYIATVLIGATLMFIVASFAAGIYAQKRYHDSQRLTNFFTMLQISEEALGPLGSAKKDLGATIDAFPESPDKENLKKKFEAFGKAWEDFRTTLQILWDVKGGVLGSSSSDWGIIATAEAQTRSGREQLNFGDARTYFLIFVFLMLGLSFVGSVVVILKTKDPEVLKFALDTVKTLLGFFTGVATTFMSVS
jgi:hypothetical protein